MNGIVEVGATGVDLKEHQCSIKKITVSTEWKAPTEEVSETVSATVYDSTTAGDEKTIYLISSPEGKEVTIKTEREEGECQRESHKKYQMSWTDYKKDDKEEEGKDDKETVKKEDKDNQSDISYSRIESKFNIDGLALAAAKDAALSSLLPVLLPFNLIRTPIKIEREIKNESELKIKCFEIGGAFEALRYLWNLFPIPLEKEYTTHFSHVSCKEGLVHYNIVSYPDISFKIEFSMGTKEAEKKKNGRSHFERQTNSIKYLPERFDALNKEALGVDITLCPPSFTLSSSYNNGDDELELKLDFKKENEFIHFRYKHGSFEIEYGSEYLQMIFGEMKKIVDICKLLNRFYNIEKDFKKIGDSVVKNYKPYKLKVDPTSVSISGEGKYQTSKDLTKIGKCLDICVSFCPLVGLSLTIDLFFLILSAASAGTGAGIYVTIRNVVTMLKNLDKVIEKLMGKGYKKKYKDTKPFDADIYFDLVVSGAVNGSLDWVINTAEENNENSTSGSIETVFKVDLKAGAKASINAFYLLSASAEFSGSGSSGIKFKYGYKDRIAQGDGLIVFFDTVFLGIILKGCVKSKVGLFKTRFIGGSLDGEYKLFDKKKIDCFSTESVFWSTKKKTESYGKGYGGGFGGGGAGRTWESSENGSVGNGHGGGGGRGRFGGGGAGRNWESSENISAENGSGGGGGNSW